MKMKDIKVGQKVTGFLRGNNEIVGKVIKKLKTVVYIDFNGEKVKYDKPHIQFLTKVKEK